ncbi:nucleoporin-like protein [Mollisia scopiformis]|uniref:Nucleoporin NUP188 n=1 Tax=Mollisia scopiformis TaxID=149040 RepID=A0A194X5E0_MOLSC|nr:nucleoporin-like protein [Mollisia scopiformis]KUJ15390.1 nucleoporin-like protein [Mollisia scopiformis]
MAPLRDASYFPSLDKCLTGEELLISWKSAFAAITSEFELDDEHQDAIQEFLQDSEVLHLLANPFEAFLEPSPQTKSTFETKTSAINVTPSSNAKYDIKQIKEDTLWLSRVARLDEVSALRVVVGECQSRAAAQLLGPFSEEELVGIREAAGNSRYSSPIPLSLLSGAVEPTTIQKNFDKEGSRRSRILRTYLSERRHFFKCTERLLHAAYRRVDAGRQENKGKQPEKGAPWLAKAGDTLYSKIAKGSEPKLIIKAIATIESNVKSIENGSGWSDECEGGDELEMDWLQTKIIETIHIMELIWTLMIYVVDCPSSDIILAWFHLQQACKFFSTFEMEHPNIQGILFAFQSTSMLVSLIMISLTPCIEFLQDSHNHEGVSPDAPTDEMYIFNTTTIMEIHSIVLEAADNGFPTAGPATLAWAYVVSAMQERVQADNTPEPSRFDRATSVDTELTMAPDCYRDTLDQIVATVDSDIVEFLGIRAVNTCRVFETLTSLSLQLGTTTAALFPYTTGSQMRTLILDLLKYALGLGYLPELMQAVISTLTGGRDYWTISSSKPLLQVDDPMVHFLSDTDLVNATVMNAQQRYPYESLPFLQMVRALAASPATFGTEPSQSVLALLEAMPVFTYTLPPHFADYETAQEEDNNNTIRLTQPVQLFEPRSKSSRLQSMQIKSWAVTRLDQDFCIPAGAYGRIISEAGPRVAFWFHEYPALKYFGKLLETFLAAGDVIDATAGGPADRDSVCEIINIIATLLLSTFQSAEANNNWKEDARRVLEQSSAGLSRNRDITSVIFDIFEQELQNISSSSGSETSLEILVNCISFIHAMLPVFPGRVWPLLARSGLLGVTRGSGQLSVIVEGVELVSGRYGFLTSCCRLYEALVDDFATNAILRRGGGRSSARFQEGDDVGTGIPDHTLSKVLFVFTRYLVDVFESSCTWRYQDQDDRQRVSLVIGAALNQVLQYAYGIESWADDDKSDQKTFKPKSVLTAGAVKKQKVTRIMDPLLPSASHIVETFLSSSSGALRFQPLLRSYFDGLATPDSTVFVHSTNLRISHITTLLSFSTTLLRVSKLLNRPSSQLEKHLFKASPLIARLYAANDFYRNPVVALFEALIVTAASGNSEPPSILGHLGGLTARNFLHMLTDLDQPLSRGHNIITIWHFLSMVVSSRQQWFANYLLTGKTPRDAMKSGTTGKEVASLEKPLLTTALEKLSKIDEIPQAQSLVMLEFVSRAQSFWPWTVCNTPMYAAFIKNISEFAGRLRPIQSSSKTEEYYEPCYQTRIASHIAEILAMHLFHSRQIGAASPLKDLKENLSFFSRFAVGVPNFNASLHASLKKNLEARFPGCTLQDLKRTTLEPPQIGKNFFYDLTLANKLLQHDSAWTGRQDGGLQMEVERANLNLSLVDAQIALFHSWKFLAIELSVNMKGDADLERMCAEVVNSCLLANCAYEHPEEVFARLSLIRTDFALVLAQRLIQAETSIEEVKNLLSVVWKTITKLRGSFERAVPDGDILYYRSLLKVLFLAVRVHAEAKSEVKENDLRASLRINQSAPIIPIILDIIKHVVSMGLRELASAVHDSPADSSPEDLSLLTGILQSCLRIPGIELYHTQIVNIVSSNSTPRVALTLFSWSDKIAIDGDPIYGELSMLFLVELSSIPLMAEQLAIDGILGHIASASITSYLRRGGVGPFADSAGLQRCYSIWVRGILPLLLNIIDAVQASVTTEVALFLEQFPTLLAQSEQALDAPETSRIVPKGQTKYITLTICSELHSMALLTFVLNGFREVLKGTTEVPDVKWDAAGVLENAEFWLTSRALLRERILPMGEREVAMVKKKNAEGRAVSALENKVVIELMGIRDVLSSGNDS